MQPGNIPTSRPTLPGLPTVAVRKPSIVDAQQAQSAPVMQSAPVSAPVLQSAPSAIVAAAPEKKGLPDWLKTAARWVGAGLGAGAVGVGVTLGLGAISATISPMIVSAATAIAGAGTFFALQKMFAPKVDLPPATTQEEFDKREASTENKSRWKAGALAVGALLATGAMGIGVDFGIKALPLSAAWQGSIQTAISPALWGFTNALAGAVTFLAIQMLTEPVSAWISRFSSKGSPIQANYTPEIEKSFIRINNAANAVNSLALSGSASVVSTVNQLRDTIRDARRAIDTALSSKEPAQAEAKLKHAGDLIGSTLVFTETVNFTVTPDLPGVMKLMKQALGPYFEDLPEATRNTIVEAAIETVKAVRPAPTDPRIPTTEAAIAAYHRPMLDALINGKIAVAA